MHQLQKKILLKQYETSFAWIFTGEKNIGKFAVAKNFANWLLKTNQHDLLIVDSEKVKIEDANNIHQFINLTAGISKYKVIIINNFDSATTSAANSLLKLLEEPRQNSIIILIASDLHKVLSTIRSRCFILRFSPNDNNKYEGVINYYKEILNCIIDEKLFEKKIDPAKLYQLLYLTFSRIVKFKSNLLKWELFNQEFAELQKLQHDAIFWHCKFIKVIKLINACDTSYLNSNYLNSLILNHN